VPGTRDERDRTSTPRPPAGDQCSRSPDVLGALYDFSYACYGHDICWQLGTLGGTTTTYAQCNARFLDAMLAHCARRHGASATGAPAARAPTGRRSPPRPRCAPGATARRTRAWTAACPAAAGVRSLSRDGATSLTGS
jgi:hypothetical protein